MASRVAIDPLSGVPTIRPAASVTGRLGPIVRQRNIAIPGGLQRLSALSPALAQAVGGVRALQRQEAAAEAQEFAQVKPGETIEERDARVGNQLARFKRENPNTPVTQFPTFWKTLSINEAQQLSGQVGRLLNDPERRSQALDLVGDDGLRQPAAKSPDAVFNEALQEVQQHPLYGQLAPFMGEDLERLRRDFGLEIAEQQGRILEQHGRQVFVDKMTNLGMSLIGTEGEEQQAVLDSINAALSGDGHQGLVPLDARNATIDALLNAADLALDEGGEEAALDVLDAISEMNLGGTPLSGNAAEAGRVRRKRLEILEEARRRNAFNLETKRMRRDETLFDARRRTLELWFDRGDDTPGTLMNRIEHLWGSSDRFGEFTNDAILQAQELIAAMEASGKKPHAELVNEIFYLGHEGNIDAARQAFETAVKARAFANPGQMQEASDFLDGMQDVTERVVADPTHQETMRQAETAFGRINLAQGPGREFSELYNARRREYMGRVYEIYEDTQMSPTDKRNALQREGDRFLEVLTDRARRLVDDETAVALEVEPLTMRGQDAGNILDRALNEGKISKEFHDKQLEANTKRGKEIKEVTLNAERALEDSIRQEATRLEVLQALLPRVQAVIPEAELRDVINTRVFDNFVQGWIDQYRPRMVEEAARIQGDTNIPPSAISGDIISASKKLSEEAATALFDDAGAAQAETVPEAQISAQLLQSKLRGKAIFDKDGLVKTEITTVELGTAERHQGLTASMSMVDETIESGGSRGVFAPSNDQLRGMQVRDTIRASDDPEASNRILFQARTAFGMTPKEILLQGGSQESTPMVREDIAASLTMTARTNALLPQIAVDGIVSGLDFARRVQQQFTDFGQEEILFERKRLSYDFRGQDWENAAYTMPIDWKSEFPDAENQADAFDRFARDRFDDLVKIWDTLGIETDQEQLNWANDQRKLSNYVYGN